MGAFERKSRGLFLILASLVFLSGFAGPVQSAPWPGFMQGIGMGGWLTNYKRFNVLREEWRHPITPGDLEHFETYITERDVKYVATCGFDHIRLGFDQIVMEEAPGKYRAATFRKIDQFLGWCEKYRVNVVLNMHKAVGNYCDIKEKTGLMDSPELQQRFIDCWLEFERRYHDRKAVVFELLNEVRGDADAKKWNDLADRTIRALRAKNPDRWIVVGPIYGGHPAGLKHLRVWDDPKVVYTFHNYDPGEFTHQRGVLNESNLYANRVMEYPSDDVKRYVEVVKLRGGTGQHWKDVKRVDIDWLARDMHDACAWLAAHPGKILWHGEFGTIRHAPPASRVAYMRDQVKLCHKYGLPYCVWNYLSTPNDGNRFSLVDDDTRTFLSPELLNACFGKDVVPKVVLTFDDGFEEHHRLVAPILEKYGFRGIFNIITDRIGKGPTDSPYGLRAYMTWDQVRDLQARGHEIASHSATHPNLRELAEKGETEKLRREIFGSRDAIVRETGVAPKYLCHPYCQTNFEVEETIRAAGMIPMVTRRKNFGTGTVAGTATGAAAYLRSCIARGETFVDILCHGVTKEGHGWMPYEKVEDFEAHIRELRQLADAGTIQIETVSPLPGEPATKPALAPDPFPDRMSAYIWRNWFCVPTARLAETVGTSVSNVTAVAVEMGLPAEPAVEAAWPSRGFVTLVRQNWHLLDYAQLMTLLGWTREQMRFALLENDFLFIKLGSIKPKCGPLVWDDREIAKGRSARWKIAAILKAEKIDDFAQEPRFAFVETLSDARSAPRAPRPVGSAFDLRLASSYFADYGDALSDDTLGSFPEGLLARLASEGVNAVWLHTVLTTLAKDPKYPEFGAGCERRLANLRKLVARAARYDMRVYIYLNEPRSQPAAFFEVGERKAFRGKGGALRAMCTSHPEVQRWLAGAVEGVFRAVPGLGGVITITASENPTNCASHPGEKDQCERCCRRTRAEILAEVNRLIVGGMLKGNPEAEAIVWNWGWPADEEAAILAGLPKAHCRVMSVSELGLPLLRGGVRGAVDEYSISAVGPHTRAKALWRLAAEAGLKTAAKVQAGSSWELGSFPYLPVYDLVAEHVVNLRAARVDGAMLAWSLGAYPSPLLGLFADGHADKEAMLNALAQRLYGPAARETVRRAWTAFAEGFRNYPFCLKTLYNGPQHKGPAHPLYPKPTGYDATMVGLPYDDLKAWTGRYPAAVWIELMQKVAEGFETGCRLMGAVAEGRECAMFRAETLHFASAADQARYLLARTAGDSATMRAVAERECARAAALLDLVRADSRLGYECSNHYFYTPQDLREKIVACRLE